MGLAAAPVDPRIGPLNIDTAGGYANDRSSDYIAARVDGDNPVTNSHGRAVKADPCHALNATRCICTCQAGSICTMPNAPKTPNRVIRVDDELWRAAQARAGERGETVSEVVRRALRRYVRTPKSGPH